MTTELAIGFKLTMTSPSGATTERRIDVNASMEAQGESTSEAFQRSANLASDQFVRAAVSAIDDAVGALSPPQAHPPAGGT